MNELINFGDAILRLSVLNSDWIKRQVNIIKTGDAGNRAGAIFEVLGLNLFQSAGSKVIASKGHNPGYDGEVDLENGASLWVSVKNHGMSSNEQDFRNRADRLNTVFENFLQELGLSGFEVRIICAEYLTPSAWNNLEIDLKQVVGSIESKGHNIAMKGKWHIVLKSLAPEFYPLSARCLSSAFFIAASTHINEQNNFIENVRRGCQNLVKHTKSASMSVCQALLLRLSASASTTLCAQWAREYFETYPDEPIGLIILYQAVVTNDIQQNNSTITHYIVPIPGPKLPAWCKNSSGTLVALPNLSVMVGRVIDKPTKQALTDGTQVWDFENYYVYQKANIYRAAKMVDGLLNIELSNPAAGIMIHADVEMEGQSAVFHMVAPNQFDLLLLP